MHGTMSNTELVTPVLWNDLGMKLPQLHEIDPSFLKTKGERRESQASQRVLILSSKTSQKTKMCS